MDDPALRGPRALVHAERLAGLAYARAWRIRNKPYFDALYGPDERDASASLGVRDER